MEVNMPRNQIGKLDAEAELAFLTEVSQVFGRELVANSGNHGDGRLISGRQCVAAADHDQNSNTWNRGDASNGLFEHTAEPTATDDASLTSKPDDSPRTLVHHDQYPIRSQDDRFASK